MSYRSSVDQRIAVGVETTPGSAVAATFEPSNGTISLTSEVSTEPIMVAGRRVGSAIFVKDVRSTGSFEGKPCLSNMADQAGFIYGDPTTADVEAGVVEADTYELGSDSKTWTVEKGDSISGEQFTNVIAQSFSLEVGYNTGDVSNKMDLAGLGYSPNITMTSEGSVTSRDVTPVSATAISVFMDPTLAEIGTTEVDLLGFTLSLGALAELRRHSTSTDKVATVLDALFTPQIVVDTLAHTLYGRIFSGVKSYVRVRIEGDLIDGAAVETRETWDFDFCVGAEGQSRADQDAVFAASCPLRVLHDSTGFYHRVVHTRAV